MSHEPNDNAPNDLEPVSLDDLTDEEEDSFLAHMRCPKCQSRGVFRIEATSVFLVFKDGTGDHEDVEWNNSSTIWCNDCRYQATVGAFTQQRCTLCEEPVHPRDFRDHLAGHSTAAESAIEDPAEFFEEF